MINITYLLPNTNNNMRHEKTIKRPDGTKYQISIYAYENPRNNRGLVCRITVFYKGKGKRIWRVIDRDISDWEYRVMSLDERMEFDKKNNLRFVTLEEIKEAKKELLDIIAESLYNN